MNQKKQLQKWCIENIENIFIESSTSSFHIETVTKSNHDQNRFDHFFIFNERQNTYTDQTKQIDYNTNENNWK